MADPFRLRLLIALTDALKEITPANGYQHDLSTAVFRGRLLFTRDDPETMVTIMEPPQLPEQLESPNGATEGATILPLLIQGFVEDDAENPTDPAYRLLADAQKRLALARANGDGFNILGMGERVGGLHIGKGIVRPPDQVVSKNAYFWLPITLEFAEDYADPSA